MTKPPKRPRDPNQLAKFIIDAASGDNPAGSNETKSPRDQKKPTPKSRVRASAKTS